MTASTSQIDTTADPPFAHSLEGNGFVTGGVRGLLRIESLALLVAVVALYAHEGFSWLAFALLFLAPDLLLLAYLAGPRVGAVGYNLAHTYTPALALTAAGFICGVPAAAAGGLIWIAHIGFDRMLGYGLKYKTSFNETHLGRIGRH